MNKSSLTIAAISYPVAAWTSCPPEKSSAFDLIESLMEQKWGAKDVARQSRNQNLSRELRERGEPANCSGALWSCEKIGIGRFPSLHHRKEGWPSDQKIIAKPPLTARPGWFSDENKWKTTPAASASVAARNFLDDAATPPCGRARRGITRDSNLFTAPMTAATGWSLVICFRSFDLATPQIACS